MPHGHLTGSGEAWGWGLSSAELSAHDRAVLVLRYWEDQSVEDAEGK
jgi:hypothetical protein